MNLTLARTIVKYFACYSGNLDITGIKAVVDSKCLVALGVGVVEEPLLYSI